MTDKMKTLDIEFNPNYMAIAFKKRMLMILMVLVTTLFVDNSFEGTLVKIAAFLAVTYLMLYHSSDCYKAGFRYFIGKTPVIKTKTIICTPLEALNMQLINEDLYKELVNFGCNHVFITGENNFFAKKEGT